MGAESIKELSISAPTDGYVLATAFVDAYLSHSAGTTSEYYCSISDTVNTQYFDGIAAAQISSGAGTGGYRLPISLTRIFQVTPGSHQFHLVCAAFSVSSITIYDRHLDLLFVPTARGTVSTSSLKSEGDHMSYSASKMEEGWVDPGDEDFSNAPSMTQADFDAEKAESIAFNLARIQAELDAIKAQAKALSIDDNNQP